MNLLMPTKKTSPRATAASDLEAEIARLGRQNASLKRAIARLSVFRAMAYRDPLTSLWNRRYFDERLKEEFSRSRRAGAGRRFSVAIIDIGVPGMDGYEVARRVRAALGQSVLLVAMTGYGQESDRLQALSAGFDTHLTKPVDIELVERILESPSPQRRPRP